jgi:hypothetical protein
MKDKSEDVVFEPRRKTGESLEAKLYSDEQSRS